MLKITNKMKVVAAAGVLVMGATGLTLAAFTDSGSVETDFKAGTLDLKFDDINDGSPDAYLVDFSLGFDNMKPGDTVTRDIKISNSGTINALASLAAPTLTPTPAAPATPLADKLTLVIKDGAITLYTGTLAGANFTGLDILAGNANGKTLNFAVTLDATATTAVAGQSVKVTLPFTTIQA